MSGVPPPVAPVTKDRVVKNGKLPHPLPVPPRSSKIYEDDVISYNSLHDSDFEESGPEADGDDIYLTLEEDAGVKPPEVYYNTMVTGAPEDENGDPDYDKIDCVLPDIDYELPVEMLPPREQAPSVSNSNSNLQPMTSSVRRMKTLLDKIESDYKPPKRLNSYAISPSSHSDLASHEMYYIDPHNTSFNRTLPPRSSQPPNPGLSVPQSYRTMQM